MVYKRAASGEAVKGTQDVELAGVGGCKRLQLSYDRPDIWGFTSAGRPIEDVSQSTCPPLMPLHGARRDNSVSDNFNVPICAFPIPHFLVSSEWARTLSPLDYTPYWVYLVAHLPTQLYCSISQLSICRAISQPTHRHSDRLPTPFPPPTLVCRSTCDVSVDTNTQEFYVNFHISSWMAIMGISTACKYVKRPIKGVTSTNLKQRVQFFPQRLVRGHTVHTTSCNILKNGLILPIFSAKVGNYDLANCSEIYVARIFSTSFPHLRTPSALLTSQTGVTSKPSTYFQTAVSELSSFKRTVQCAGTVAGAVTDDARPASARSLPRRSPLSCFISITALLALCLNRITRRPCGFCCGCNRSDCWLKHRCAPRLHVNTAVIPDQSPGSGAFAADRTVPSRYGHNGQTPSYCSPRCPDSTTNLQNSLSFQAVGTRYSHGQNEQHTRKITLLFNTVAEKSKSMCRPT
ncbi:hypothetical protein J6590_021133 [Homalodisca vitripennis]|nr:hypothetical protein J6590_021133 [Homalodisca vitripennis]